ncbi:RDD family protein [Actinoplanes sp. NPDC051861]|uniref:RDD family protein n=1 Tax=Actinoplanes sp. NPDC051861 TaxID=3155170 RepID=UPI003425F4BD
MNAEAVEIDVRPARLGSRALALMVDIVMQVLLGLVLLILSQVALSALPPWMRDAALSDTVLRVVLVAVVLLYPALIETFTNGRSVGKLAVGLRVIREDGGPIRFRHSFTRALVGLTVEWPGLLLPLVTWVVSLGTMLSSRRGRRIGDLAAGTLVVHVRRPDPWRPVPPMPIHLAEWAAVADLSAMDDELGLAVRQYLSREFRFREPHRASLGAALAAEVTARVSPAPPPGTQPWFMMVAVTAERRRRAELQVTAGRALTGRIWSG